jgi:hypothetical protein
MIGSFKQKNESFTKMSRERKEDTRLGKKGPELGKSGARL